MHVKNDYSHRDGDRYTTLETLQLLLAMESDKSYNTSASALDVTSPCNCLLPCQCITTTTTTTRNQQSVTGTSALHAAVLGALELRHSSDEQQLVARVSDVLGSGSVDVNARDQHGETALSLVRHLLRRGSHRLAMEIASQLLDCGASVDAEDRGRQTLLSHSVAALDASSDLTRLLLNRGADVWHPSAPFGSFLQAVVRCRNVDGAAVTADLLGRTMGSRPEAFRSLVLRSMVRHGRCVRVLGPVFVQLKSILSPYWRQPHPLRYAAWNVIRRHSTAGQLHQLALPSPLLRYLTMDD